MNYKIINTGSDGNCTIINDIIAIDMGVSFKKLSSSIDIRKLQLVLLTHVHGDHFNKSTLKTLSKERPILRFGCCEWLVDELVKVGVKRDRIDVYEIGTKYDYSKFQLVPIKLYHDVPQCGYRLFMNDKKLIYCTDTNTLDGIQAKNYDVYLVEGNYKNEEELRSRSDNEYYCERVLRTHLSREYATEWLLKNMGNNSKYEFMHKHRERKNDRE